MKTSIVLAVSIVLVSFLFCPMVMAFPPLPEDLQMVQPDPSLAKEPSAFFGKWEWHLSGWYRGTERPSVFIIVEKIDEEKASLYIRRDVAGESHQGWARYEAKVIKVHGKYILSFQAPWGKSEYTIKGAKIVDFAHSDTAGPYSRVREPPMQ